MRRPIRVLFVVGIVFLGGCGLAPLYTRANEQDPNPANCPPTRAGMLALDDGVFVGIAISGGGSRAANFSAAALLELQDLGFLQTASAISSVSGGSLTAAYYAIFGRDPSRWNREVVRDLMLSDFQTRWILAWFAPHNVIRYWLTDFDRSDIMKQVFDGVLFHGATFRAMGSGRPRLLLNATSRTRADTFVFTDQSFAALGSCLADYPVSHAVIASGAFPAALQDVTLEDYRHLQGPGENRRYFKHLYDGGAVDNLGVETLRGTVQTLWNESGGARPTKCFFFIVDAYTTPERPELETERDTRAGFDYIVDANVISAFDALLSARRSDILWNLGFSNSEIGHEPFQLFDLPIDDEEGSRTVPCAAWHLTFQRLVLAGIEGKTLDRGGEDLARMNHVGWVVNRIRTRYNLASPDPYTDRELQDYLFEAGSLLVRRDTFALPRACRWFRDNGFTVCRDLP